MAGKLVKHILTDLSLQFFLCLFQLQWTFCFSVCHCHLYQGNVEAFPLSPSAAHTRIFLSTFLFFHLLHSLLYHFKRLLAGSSQSWLFQRASSLTSALLLMHPELTPKYPEKTFPSTALSAGVGCDHQPLWLMLNDPRTADCGSGGFRAVRKSLRVGQDSSRDWPWPNPPPALSRPWPTRANVLKGRGKLSTDAG